MKYTGDKKGKKDDSQKSIYNNASQRKAKRKNRDDLSERRDHKLRVYPASNQRKDQVDRRIKNQAYRTRYA